MNTIIKIYFYNVHTHETIQSNQTLKNLRLGRAPSNHQYVLRVMILYGLFSCNLILAVPLTVK